MSGTDVRCLGMCYAMSGTDIARGAPRQASGRTSRYPTFLRARYAVSTTDSSSSLLKAPPQHVLYYTHLLRAVSTLRPTSPTPGCGEGRESAEEGRARAQCGCTVREERGGGDGTRRGALGGQEGCGASVLALLRAPPQGAAGQGQGGWRRALFVA
eukprot:3468864-Rhodomonas_salina.1